MYRLHFRPDRSETQDTQFLFEIVSTWAKYLSMNLMKRVREREIERERRR